MQISLEQSGQNQSEVAYMSRYSEKPVRVRGISEYIPLNKNSHERPELQPQTAATKILYRKFLSPKLSIQHWTDTTFVTDL